MLVLTRRLGEELVIGHNIRLTVVGIAGKKVRLGIIAPVETPRSTPGVGRWMQLVGLSCGGCSSSGFKPGGGGRDGP